MMVLCTHCGLHDAVKIRRREEAKALSRAYLLPLDISSALHGFEIIHCSAEKGEADRAPWIKVPFAILERKTFSVMVSFICSLILTLRNPLILIRCHFHDVKTIMVDPWIIWLWTTWFHLYIDIVNSIYTTVLHCGLWLVEWADGEVLRT